MATIQLKRSAVPAKTPTTSDLALGEIGINTYDGKMYIKKDDGTPSVVQIGAPELPDYAGVYNKFLSANGGALYWTAVSASPAGSNGQIQYNNAGSLAGAGNVTISSSGDLNLRVSASPSVMATDNTLLYRGQFPYPTPTAMHRGMGISSGNFVSLQPSIGSKDIGWWNPPGNATTVPGVLGLVAPTATGTATARTTSTTSAVARTRRLGYVSAAAINSGAGQSWTVRQWTYGDGNGLGGFYMSYMFAVSDAALTSTGRWTFVGMTNQSGPLTSLPTTACFGLIQDIGGTNYKMRCAGGTQAADVDLGVNFPVDVTSVYEVRLYNNPFDSDALYYEVIRLNTGHVARGSFLTTGLSINSTTLMAPQAMRNTGTASALAAGIDICHLYIEKNF